ncbi:fasciclin domain-containing protein [Sediminibacter sp. Hel_I_10]|uniref:fasciclin domain-containing protein n=1 Tax=Sediminibacter sp. Hel_I_10 TaxID=1392490 RepID=UPI00047D9A92|nr:fasciclin domain-containing protein [Sediminibacter sp. Hel_I_10]
MKIISKTIKILPLLFVVFAFQACSDDDDATTPVPEPTLLNIFATADASADLTNLVAALEEADLDMTLQGDGPFTVFAPTNDALAALLSANGWATLADVPDDILENVLLNHVISGETIMASDLTTAGSGYVNTLGSGADDQNLSLYFNINGNVVELNGGAENSTDINAGANVITADIMATNGVVHIVNSVIMPPTIADHALANPNLSSLVAALASADSGTPTVSGGYIPTVSDATAGPFTILAPTNAAFEALLLDLDPSGETALGDVDTATVDAILTFHITGAGNVQSSGLAGLNGSFPSLGGNISLDATELTVTDDNDRVSNIIPELVNIQATNGVVHAIDQVLLPLQED